MAFLTEAANRGSISTEYDIDNSYKNENDNTERMYRAWGGITANTRTWTVSLWIKRTELGACYTWGAGTSGNDVLVVDFDSSDRLGFRSTKDAANDCVYRTNRVFRDTSAWYHLVFAVDTTSGTAGNRLRIYVNGVEETSFATETNFDQNDLTLHNANGSYMEVGAVIGESPRFHGYIAEVNSITGTQYAPTAFGRFDENGIWVPILFAGSYAENSVFLEFKDSSSLGTDTSGNSQTFTLQNLSAADQATDTPTNNFCTLNNNSRTNANIRTQEGGSKVTTDGGSGWCSMNATMGAKSGKWYWEAEHMSSDSDNVFWGVAAVDDPYIPHRAGGYYLGNVAAWTSMGLYSYNGQVYNGTWQNGTGHLANSSNDVIMFALDADNGYFYFGKNGTWGNSSDPTTTGGTAAATLSTTQTNPWTDFIVPSVSVFQGMKTTFNFGGYTAHTPSSAASDANGYGTFEHAPPTGYYALCSKNLAEYG